VISIHRHAHTTDLDAMNRMKGEELMQELTPAFLQSAHDQSSISVHLLWMIPAVPIMASGVIALLKQPCRKTAASLAIGSLSVSLLLSLFAFVEVVSQ